MAHFPLLLRLLFSGCATHGSSDLIKCNKTLPRESVTFLLNKIIGSKFYN